MARFIKTNKEDIGLSPDAYKLRGVKKSDKVLLRIIDFDTENLEERELKNINEAISYSSTKTTSWFNIDGLHDNNIMHEIAVGFELDSLILSDVMHTEARPKIHEYDNCLYISLKMLKYDENINKVDAENLVIVIKKNILISFQERKGDVFEPLRERIRKNKRRVRASGTDYLAYALIDIVIDNYSYIIGRIGEKIESIEEKLLDKPNSLILEEINIYKREIVYLLKLIKPCREVIMNLVKMDSEFMHKKMLVHIKDLHDNINQVNDTIESYREILSDHINIYHTTMSSKLNDIMKFLTIFSVIFIPLTFIAGVYGTNFDVVPELHFKYSYFIMWGVMIIVALTMVFYFKKKKWF